jgi:hypothetical protein
MSQVDEKRSLTPEDPVDAETLEHFRKLQEARQRFAESLLSLEQEKIQLLAAVKKLDDQRNRLFEGCLVERGMTPDTEVEIDARTGRISGPSKETAAPKSAAVV